MSQVFLGVSIFFVNEVTDFVALRLVLMMSVQNVDYLLVLT
jgi:hypothetical protein